MRTILLGALLLVAAPAAQESRTVQLPGDVPKKEAPTPPKPDPVKSDPAKSDAPPSAPAPPGPSRRGAGSPKREAAAPKPHKASDTKHKDVLPPVASTELSAAPSFEPGQNIGKIVFSANLDPQGFNDTETGSVNIEDLSPAANEAFPQRTGLQYEVEHGRFTCSIPAIRSQTIDVPYAFNLRIHQNSTSKVFALGASGAISGAVHQETPPQTDLAYVLTIGGAILLAVILTTAIWYFKNRRRVSFSPPPSRSPVQPMDPPPAYPAVSAPSYTVPPAVTRSLNEISQRIADLERIVNALALRPGDDWRAVLGDVSELQALSGVNSRPANSANRLRAGDESSAMVAIVNQWIAVDGANRQRMFDMAAELNQDMKLMEHVNVARLLSDVTALGAVDLAESVTDGGWLYRDTPGGVAIVAPADSRLFQSTHDRALLQRMFDGVDAASAPVLFARIFRPCQIRRKQANRYEIVRKGLIQLAGQPSPVAMSPLDYDSLRQQEQPSAFRPTAPATLVSVVKAQLEMLNTRISRMENSLNVLTSRGDTPVSAARIADLDRVVLATVRGELQHVEQRLGTATRNTPTSATPAVAVKRLTEDVGALKSAFREFTERIDGVEASLQTRSANIASLAPSFHRDYVPERAAAATVTLPAPKPEDTSWQAEPSFAVKPKSLGLPAGWQEAIAALQPFQGLAERDMTAGLQELLTTLQALPPASTLRFVHLMESMGKFRVHAAVANEESQVCCEVCGGSRTFQTVVCAGEQGAPELQVLLPAGEYAPYNYAAGYRQLIQNMPNQQFRLHAIVAPAVLILVEGSSPAEYSVQSRTQWK